ncbi:chromatin assembly factor 1 subunit A, partial [Lepus europaeus]|uniref:chromatin assembly factor 1 subunit A n=1 Tax=Lepus europaeus TaxID=9983 RepID=UPI002B4AA7AD
GQVLAFLAWSRAGPCRRTGGAQPPVTRAVSFQVTKKLIREKNKLRLQRDREVLREQRERLREAARRAKEEARRKREAEKELRERERREKRAKDQEEKAEKLRRKEERRRERQEALEAKLEEKRKKEEEKRLREEEKRIKAEKAEITRFFQKPKTPQAPKTLAGSCGKFAPFEIKEHMVLAPQSRATFGQDLCRQLDQLLWQQGGDFSFLKDLKSRRPLRSGPTGVCGRSAELFNSDVVIVGGGGGDGVPERRKFGRMKLLQFSENHRPAYWGTWNKKTTVIRPRDPWARDWTLLDYEVDSDEEWEEEEPGESLSHSEGDDDDDVGEDEDEDDGFFVPHGYLSEDEGVTEECADPENHKVRQKLKAKEWDEFLAKGKRFRVLQPVKIGCVWAATAGSCAGADLRVLQQFTACFLDTAPADDEHTPKASKREKRDQQILAQLLPLLHGNVHGSKVIIREFQERCRRGLLGQDTGSPPSPGCSRPQTPTAAEDSAVPSKARLKRLISENSVYEKRPDFRMCWYVHPRVLKSFDQEHLPVPCQWSYVTSVPSAPREDGGPVPTAPPGQATPVSLKRKSAGSMCITQFMKKRRHDGQAGATDMDGFQADTEEEEDGDCVILAIPDAGGVPCGAGAGAAAGMDGAEGALPAGLLGAS